MSGERVDLGFGSELDAFNPDEWKTKPKAKTTKQVKLETRKIAEATGFTSREPVQEQSKPSQRRRTTGRNRQFNIKAKTETIEAFYAVADENDWGLGETLEHAVALLEVKYLK